MKKLILLLTCISLLHSCSKNETSIINEEIENEASPKITKITQTTNIGVEGYVEYTYNNKGFIDKAIGNGENIRQYFYNDNNQIIKSTYQSVNSNYSIEFTYENNVITSKTYDNGNTENYSYNSSGLLTSMESSGNIVYFNYDNNQNIIEKIFNGEIIDSYEYDEKPNPVSLAFPEAYKKIQFITNNNRTYRKDGDRVTTYEYNSYNLPIKSTTLMVGGVTEELEFFYSE